MSSGKFSGESSSSSLKFTLSRSKNSVAGLAPTHIMTLSPSMTFSFIRPTNESPTRSYVCPTYTSTPNLTSVFDTYSLTNLGNVSSNLGPLCTRITRAPDFILAFLAASSPATSTPTTPPPMTTTDFPFVTSSRASAISRILASLSSPASPSHSAFNTPG